MGQGRETFLHWMHEWKKEKKKKKPYPTTWLMTGWREKLTWLSAVSLSSLSCSKTASPGEQEQTKLISTSQRNDVSVKPMSCCHEISPPSPEDVLTLGPGGPSFSSRWTRSCSFAFSCSKASTVPRSVWTEALSLRSTVSCEGDNSRYSVLEL